VTEFKGKAPSFLIMRDIAESFIPSQNLIAPVVPLNGKLFNAHDVDQNLLHGRIPNGRKKEHVSDTSGVSTRNG
jgi:hypothetical protein